MKVIGKQDSNLYGLYDGTKEILPPQFGFISEPYPWRGGEIRIFKDEDWRYGIAFINGGNVESLWQSDYTTPIMPVNSNGPAWFYCEEAPRLFDYQGNFKESR
ncbi:MAG: hypothetical protein IJJ82_03490 [Clostridia bacterium]|nr:hypothetical protein [Clostridia bacterium]